MSRPRVNGAGGRRSGGTRIFAVVGLVSLAAVGAALVSQHMFDMQPCPWCVLQRVIFLAIAIACAIGYAWRHTTGRVVAAGLSLLFALCGIAAALWQHFEAAASASCNLTLADKITSQWLQLDSLAPEIFSARASCADAAVNLFGLPYDFWSLGLFILIAVAMLRLLAARR
jgi:protein dithiol:quinone oxidoreductase